ncbi:hypothetical protein CRG98_030616 [Punica granatum]|uniref:G-patch domain-containing protein n=1 Tax=Punica granatum TaxID=22663 RepID=A0A2I0IYE7_PUNGR|nr:hypothetical protein CRG98_030616 [Punica granatum]
MPTRDIVVPNPFATIQSILDILLDLRDEEIRHELRHGWEHSVRTAWLIDFIHIRSLSATGESYQRDACHGFLLLIFRTILFPYSSNLINEALAQVILQVVGGHSYVEAVLAETIRSLDYVFRPSDRDYTDWKQFMEGLTLAQFLWAARWNLGSPMTIGCPSPESSDNSVVYRIYLQRRIALHTALCGQTRQLHFQTGFYEFGKFDACGALASFRNFTSQSIPLMMSELSQLLQYMWLSSIRRGSHLFVGYARILVGHPPPIAQTASNLVDFARFTALQGMVNQLATNMATNMTEFMAMLRNQNRASSSFTPPLEHRPIVDPNPTVLPTFVSEVEDASSSVMASSTSTSGFLIRGSDYACAATANHANASSNLTVPPPVAIAQAPVPTADQFPFETPQSQISFSYPAPPPLNIPLTESGTPIQTAPLALPTNIPPKAKNEQEKRIRRMEETIRALQVGNSRLDHGDSDWNLFPGMRLPPKIKIPDFKRYDGTRDPRHHLRHYQSKMLSYCDYKEFVIQIFQDSLMGSALDWFMTLKASDRGKAAKHIPPITERQQVQLFHSTLRGAYYSHLLAHTSSFSDLIEAGKKLDMGVKLGRIEGPSRKKDGETSKKQIAGTSRRGKDATVGAINSGHQASQPILVDYTPALQTSQAYAHPMHYVQPYQASQAYFPTPLIVIQSQPPQQYALTQAQQGRPPTSRSPQPAQCALAPRTQLGNAAQPRQLKQYTTLPALPSHIFRQLLACNKIKTEAPGPNFDPVVQNQNLRCEFHQGAPGNTLDNCWTLRNIIQEMIDTRQISFNEVKPPNVRANPFPDHGSSSGPSVNMISIAAIRVEEDAQETSVPFIVNYALANGAFTSVSFIVEVPTKEPYQNHRVPWDYGNEGPKLADKGKASAVTSSTTSEATPLRAKKVTEQEAKAFMKVIKASEYKVVEQMGKSPTHISLLALLSSSERHRDALLKVLIAAQVPKETTPDKIKETVNSIFSNQISFADDELPSEDYGEIGPSQADRMIGKVLLKNDYVPGTGLGARALGIIRPIEVEEYHNRRGLDPCLEIVQARRGKHLHRLAARYEKLSKGIPVPSLSHFFAAPPQVMGGTSDDPSTESDDSSSDAVEAFLALPAIYAVTDKTSFGFYIHPAREDEELAN